MCLSTVAGFIVILLFAFTRGDDVAKHYQTMQTCIRNSTNIKNAKSNLKTCVNDYIDGNKNISTCQNQGDVNRTYDSLFNSYSTCLNGVDLEIINISTKLRKEIFTVSLMKEKIEEFTKNDGKRCVNEMEKDILQCLNNTLQIKGQFEKNISHALLKVHKPLLFDRKPCTYTAEIKACIQRIPKNDCNITKQYIVDLQDFLIDKYCKMDTAKPSPSKYSSTGAVIGALVGGIVIIAAVFIVYKKRHSLCRKRNSSPEDTYSCSYNVAKEQVTT